MNCDASSIGKGSSMNFSRTLLLTLAFLTTHQIACGDEAAKVEFFERRIRPVLIRHCYECHSAAATEVKGGLRLDSRDLIRKGGESGPAVVPRDTKRSLLLDAIRHESFEMPPDKKLSAKIIAGFVKWIDIGAPDPRDRPPSSEEVAELSWKSILEERRQWWSLQPFDPNVAKLAKSFGHDSRRVTQQIDAFISAKQESSFTPRKNALSRSERRLSASDRILARRLSLVLTGLPPAPTEVEQFVKASTKNPGAAYEAFVDRFLDSPHFGEQWARHWMDVVRFAETHGYEWNH